MRFSQMIRFLLLTIGIAVLLSACGPATANTQILAEPTSDNQLINATSEPAVQTVEVDHPNYWVEQVPQIDDQGAVSVEITPLNPNNPGHTLDFSVTINTHSVDLSMDLAALATLETDTGHIVQALVWDAPQGGHHVRGTLSFPAGVDRAPLLQDASKMTLTLVDLDAPERVFTWNR